MQRVQIRTIPILAILIFHSVPVIANPSTKKPDTALAAHGTIDGAQQLVEDLYQLYAEAEQALLKMHESKNDPTRWSDRVISTHMGMVWKALRDAEHLQLMGEPAGFDLLNKFKILAKEYYQCAGTYRVTPKGNAINQRMIAALDRGTTARNKKLAQSEKILNSGSIEEFNSVMEKDGVSLHQATAFMSSSQAKKYTQQFYTLLDRGDVLLDRQRKTRYREAATGHINEELGKAQTLVVDSSKSVAVLKATGSISLEDGTTIDAIQAIDYLTKNWGKASSATTRAAAIHANFFGIPQSSSSSPVNSKQVAMTKEMEKNLSNLIDIIGATATPETVTQSYGNILKSLSVIERRCNAVSIFQSCKPALDRFIAKYPQAEAQSKSYRRATFEILRWRKLFAKQRADVLTKSYRDLPSVLSQELPIKNTNRPPSFNSSAGSRPTKCTLPMFNAPANWMVFEAGDRLLNRPVSVSDAVRLASTNSVIAPFKEHHYASATPKFDSAPAVAELKRHLLVDDTHPPLSHDAASAISSAEMGDFKVIGGTIESLHLESVAARMIDLHDALYSISSIGTSPTFDREVPLVEQTCWRVQVAPKWARHEYYVLIDAPPKE